MIPSIGNIRELLRSAYPLCAALAALLLLSAAAGCTGAEQADAADDAITVAVTIPPQAEFVETGRGGSRPRCDHGAPGSKPAHLRTDPGRPGGRQSGGDVREGGIGHRVRTCMDG